MSILNKKFKLKVSKLSLVSKPDAKTFKGTQTFKTLHNDFANKDNEYNQSELTIPEILHCATHGKVLWAGEEIEIEQPLTGEQKRDLHDLMDDPEEFHAEMQAMKEANKLHIRKSALAIIDVDNDYGNVAPASVIEFIKPSGYYFTFSHQTISENTKRKQNAMRLLFALDKPVERDMLEFIESRIAGKILNQFPNILGEEGQKLYGEVVGTASKALVFGSQNEDTGYYPNNYLKVADYEKTYQLHIENERLRALEDFNYKSTPTSDNELLDMAQFLADRCFHTDTHKEWETLAIGVWNSCNEGQYSEELALQLLRTIDFRDESTHTDSYYYGFNRSNNASGGHVASIGTLIYYAVKNGFKRDKIASLYTEAESVDVTPTEHIEIEKHISPDLIVDMLNSPDKNILIDSDTGTGKTTAIINALKEYLKDKENTSAYLAVPVRVLASQLDEQHNLGHAIMENIATIKAINEAFKINGVHLNVGTYDKAEYWLKAIGDSEAIVIADEAHKEVADYGYRKKAIKSVFNLRTNERISKFIGLSGTPQEIDKTYYDKCYVIHKEDESPVFNEFLTVVYHKDKEFLENMAKIISKEVLDGQKVLCFINSKSNIDSVAKALTEQGHKVATLTSDNITGDGSEAYQTLLTEEKFPACDVLLATNVIADGINIKNDSENYTCIIASHYKQSPIFNVSTIKQATNRFRNQYKRVLMPVFISTENYDTEEYQKRKAQVHPFGLEAKYQQLHKQANNIAGEVRRRFKDKFESYEPSTIEIACGLVQKNQYSEYAQRRKKTHERFNAKLALEEEAKLLEGARSYDVALVAELEEIRTLLFTPDERAIRKMASLKQEEYYKYFYNAFIKAVETILNMPEKRLELTEYLAGSNVNESSIEQFIEDLTKFKELEEEEKAVNVADILTETKFDWLQNEYFATGTIREDTEAWKCIKYSMNKRQYNVLKSVIAFTDYQQAIKVIKSVEADKQIHLLRKSLNAVKTIELLDKNTGANTVTINILANMNEFLQSQEHTSVKEIKAHLKGMIKEFKLFTIPESTLYTMYEDHFTFDITKRLVDGKQARRRINHKFITIDDVARQFDFTPDEIKNMINKFNYESCLY